MKHYFQFTILLVPFLLCISFKIFAAPPDSLTYQRIDQYVQRQMKDYKIPGAAVGIILDTRIAYLKGYGIADNSGRKVTPQTPFLLASVTKSFTALCIMQLVEEGKIDLDAPAQKYIPWFHTANAGASSHITVRHLLNRKYLVDNLIRSREDLIKELLFDRDKIKAVGGKPQTECIEEDKPGSLCDIHYGRNTTHDY
ncbi:MAG TPA: serine hydrolase domain-containing protein [Cyclobacteriaceae bacterium]|nr:serine hydrolase domain-containing protein [Cyclobacteriaceae bacterium]